MNERVTVEQLAGIATSGGGRVYRITIAAPEWNPNGEPARVLELNSYELSELGLRVLETMWGGELAEPLLRLSPRSR